MPSMSRARDEDCERRGSARGQLDAPVRDGPDSHSGPGADDPHHPVLLRDQVPVGEGLHHVFGGHGGVAHFPRALPAGDRRPAFQLDETGVDLAARRGQGEAHLVLSAGDHGAAQGEARRSILQLQRDIAGEAVAAERINGDGQGGPGAQVEAGRRHAQLEIGPGLADAQAVGVLGAALALGVAQLQVISSVGGQLHQEVGVGLMREQAGALVVEIVVEGQFLAGGIGEAQLGIERANPGGGPSRRIRSPLRRGRRSGNTASRRDARYGR